jgi:hypothetical protein
MAEGHGRLVPKVIFLKEKSSEVKVMTLTFFEGHPENTFRRFL